MPSLRFDQPPLQLVVFTLGFDPIAQIMDRYGDVFQDYLRRAGYPLDETTPFKDITLKQGPDNQSAVEFREGRTRDFLNRNRTIMIRLNKERLSVHFTDYSFFDNAKPHLFSVLNSFAESVPDLTIREIGLRYVNCIPLEKAEEPTKWIHSALLGLPSQPNLNLDRMGSVTETAFGTNNNGKLVVRCAAFSSGFTVPPDLLPLKMTFRQELQRKEPFILVENIHQRTKEESFDSSLYLDNIRELRKSIHSLFEALTTPHAHQKWHKQS